MQRRYPETLQASPPADVQPVVDAITALLGGEKQDFSAAVLDMHEVPQFHQQVYAVARTIPGGATLTYGDIATRLGDRRLAREVGEALGQNPFPIIVPCHRVLAAGGKVGGFSAPGGSTAKIRMLELEGVHVGPPEPAQQSLGL